MSLPRIAWANLKANPLSTFLSVLLLALGIATILFVVRISEQVTDSFGRDIRGIDMVVGAKGSPLQLILSAVYQMDNPTGNIPLAEARKLGKHPLVKQTIPLAYGDSYKGFRIIGTEWSYPQHYSAELADGRSWNAPMEVVLGSHVASNLNMKTGDHFHGSHGFDAQGHVHEDEAYQVVGVLAQTGSVIDKLVLTSMGSVWDIHDHGEAKDTAAKQITAMLVMYKSPMAMMQLPRMVNQNTSMQAALPAIEINRLYSLLGVGFDTIKIIGIVMLLVSAISVFISLLNSLKDRKFELALLRSLGGSPMQISALLMLESLFLCVIGWFFGVILANVAMMIATRFMDASMNLTLEKLSFSTQEPIMLLVACAIGTMASVLPAIQAYRTDISSTLRNE